MEQAESSQENRTGNPVTAVLILAHPPDTILPGEWYQRTLAGVPFLLRNLLNLQKGGVERIVIYSPEPVAPESDPLPALARDSRIRCEVEWIPDWDSLHEVLRDSSSRLVVNGSALTDSADVAALLNGSLDLERQGRVGYQRVSRTDLRQWLPRLEVSGGTEPSPPPNPDSRDEAAAGIELLAGGPETRVQRDEDFRVQHERLLTQGGMDSDSFMDRWVSRYFSRQFTRLLIDTPVTPNQITWMNLAAGLGSAVLFYQGTYAMVVAGAMLLMISAWLDSTDGEVARLRFQQSRYGMILDVIGDNVVHWAVFLGIGWGVAHMTGNSLYQVCGVLSMVGAMASFGLLEASVFKKRSGAEYESSGWEDELANRDFLYFLFVMALVDQLQLFIMITAVGSNVFAGYVLYKKLKSS